MLGTIGHRQTTPDRLDWEAGMGSGCAGMTQEERRLYDLYVQNPEFVEFLNHEFKNSDQPTDNAKWLKALDSTLVSSHDALERALERL